MKNGFVHIKTVAEKVLTKTSDGKIALLDEKCGGIPTGFGELDRNLGGLYPRGMYIVAARPGMGKTAFTLQIVLNALQNEKKPVYIFSAYLTAEEIFLRMVSMIAKISTHSLRKENLSEKEQSDVEAAIAFFSGSELYINHSPFPEAEDIARFIREEVKDGLAVIDGIQEVCLNKNRPFNRKILDGSEMAIISREIKLAAFDAGSPVIITSQLSREPELRGDNIPCLEDLDRTVGLLQSDADGVIFLYREAYYHDSDNEDKAQIILAKNRWGSTANIPVGFDGRCARFYDL